MTNKRIADRVLSTLTTITTINNNLPPVARAALLTGAKAGFWSALLAMPAGPKPALLAGLQDAVWAAAEVVARGWLWPRLRPRLEAVARRLLARLRPAKVLPPAPPEGR